MIYVKTKTYGLETKIKLVQQYIDEHLPEYWEGTAHIYSVIQPTVKAGKIIPEVYVGNGEHRQIFFDDKRACVIGFDINSRNVKGLQNQANVDVIFNVNLKKIHGNDLRETERAIMEANRLIKACSYISTPINITETIRKVFNGYSLDDVNMNDLQPFYCFSFTCNVLYSDNYDDR